MEIHEEQLLRLAMIGCGGRAGVHAPEAGASPNIEITTWLDVDPKKAESFAASYGGRVADKWEDILNDEEVEGVVIALPHDLHHKFGVEAARAGKHIMMEIPICKTLDEADELISETTKAGVVLLVLHSLRFWKSQQYIRDLVKSGTLGQPFFARYHNEHYVPADYFGRQPGHLAAEAGVLHHGDIMRWWVGEVEAVTGFGMMFEQASKDYGTFDHITVLYEIEGGALGESTTNWISRLCPENQMVRGSVSCTEGTVVTTWTGEIRVYSEKGALPGGETHAIMQPEHPNRPSGEIRHFADCIRGVSDMIISPHDARQALLLALASRDSARSKQRIALRDYR